jgi:hypothetical protein
MVPQADHGDKNKLRVSFQQGDNYGKEFKDDPTTTNIMK